MGDLLSMEAARAGLAECRQILKMPPVENAWWAGLTVLDKKYLLKSRGYAMTLATCQWSDLPRSTRGGILEAAKQSVGRLSDKRRALA